MIGLEVWIVLKMMTIATKQMIMIFKLVFLLDVASVTSILFMEQQGAMGIYLQDLISLFNIQNKASTQWIKEAISTN